MARVASRHLSGTLTTPNRLLRFPVETTERASEPKRNVQSASQRRCRFRSPSRATKKFPFFFFFWEKAAAGLYFRWKRTLPSDNHSSNAVPIETVNFFLSPFSIFFLFFVFTFQEWICILRWDWIYENVVGGTLCRWISSREGSRVHFYL